MKYILFWMYLSRAILILLFMLSPKDQISFYLFAIGLARLVRCARSFARSLRSLMM